MILYLNCNDNPITFNKKNYLLRAAKRLGFDFVKDIKDRVGECEYVLNIEPSGFLTGSKWTGVWEIDLLCDRNDTGRGWETCNDIFLAGYAMPSRLDKLRCKTTLLFQACDTEIHKKTRKEEYDFVQCGSGGDGLYAERTRLQTLLRKTYSFHDFGKEKKPEEYVANVSTARVQFIRSMKSPIADGEIAQRLFEGLAIGPVITNYVPDLELLGLEEGKDYYSYKSDDELLSKFDYLIKHEDFRLKMAASGRKKALMYHTYEHRLLSILNLIHEGQSQG